MPIKISNGVNANCFGKKVLILILVFFIFQLLSFFAYLRPAFAGAVFILIILGTVGLALYKIEYGFLILVFELLSGQGGHLFEFFGLSLRLALFLTVMLVWLVKKLRAGGLKKQFSHPLIICFLVLFFFILIGFVQGVLKNDPVLAVQDFINYAYFLLIFPLVDVLKGRLVQAGVKETIKAATLGIAVLTVGIFILFATGLVEVHDAFYWWWRNAAVGKATFAGNNFFRIVSPAHLVILPLFLVYLSFLAGSHPKGSKQKQCLWLGISASLSLLINFSRAYFLGIFAGLIILARGLTFKRWISFFLIVVFVLLAEFGLIYASVSGGKVFEAFNFFGQRMGTVISPEEELSSLSRMNILPVLTEKLKKAPVFGQGLGTTVSYYNPITESAETTYHLDWGYLEIWLELGFFGLVSYLALLGMIFRQGWREMGWIKKDPLKQRLMVGLLAGMVALAVATLTGPFLFHPLGIFYLTLTAAVIINYKEVNI